MSKQYRTTDRRQFMKLSIGAGATCFSMWVETDELARGQADCTLPPPATATPFVFNEPKVVERISCTEIASRSTQLAQFRDAIAKERALPATDVIGWTKQIAQHCLGCAPSNNNNVHFNWQFVGWHRALLYFLERILRKKFGPDDLRMIYWDWENTNSRRMPDIYAPAGQSLYWANRRVVTLSASDVNVQPLLAIPDFRTFGGTAAQRSPTPAIFGGPHANVHNSFAPGDMADLQFSPRDPVFYAHHSNIDRLWSSWIKAGHQNPDFGQAKVYFYDENAKWRSVLLNDVRDETKLGYKYSSLMQPQRPASQLRTFTLLKRPQNLMRFTPQAIEPIKSASPGPHYLIIQDIQNLTKFAADTLRYGIFYTPPPVGTAVSDFPGYLGKVSNVASAGHVHAAPLTAAIEVTGKLATALGSGTDLSLTVAPLDAEGKTTAAGIPLVAENVSLIE